MRTIRFRSLPLAALAFLTIAGTLTAQAVHSDRLVALSRDEAKEATAAAERHKQLAGVAR